MKPGRALQPRAAGFSLIELLVSMAIGLILTLAITSIMIRTEGSKRSTTSVNDINQTGSYAAFVLDRAVRSAGSSFAQSWSTVFGCRLDVSQGGTHVLPIPGAIGSSSAFANVTSATLPIRMAPVIIAKDLADTTTTPIQVRGDVLMVMAGTGGVGESAQVVQPASVSASGVRLQNALGYGTDDLVLLADTGVLGGCMMQQVDTRTRSVSSQNLPFGGTYFGQSGTNVNLTDFGASTIALQMGNAANLPQFQLYAVGENNTLSSMDLLTPFPSGTPDIPIADGVVEMRALYGVDTTNPPDGILDTWIDPVATSGYEATVLMDGTPASQAKLRQIVAIRLGFILRTSLQERPEDYQLAAGTKLTLFDDLLGGTLRRERTLSGAELNYRYRTVEVTVPLRNVLLAPQS